MNGADLEYIYPPEAIEAEHKYKYVSSPVYTQKSMEKSNKYFIRVRAINAKGNGAFSRWNLVGTCNRQMNVIVLKPPTVQIDSLRPLQLHWKAGCHDEDSVASYIVEVKFEASCKRFTEIYRGQACSCESTVPDVGGHCRIRLRSTTTATGFASSPFSPAVSVLIPAKLASKSKVQLPKKRTRKQNKISNLQKPEVESKPLTRAVDAIRRRRLPWHRRHPFLSLGLFVTFLIGILITTKYLLVWQETTAQ